MSAAFVRQNWLHAAAGFVAMGSWAMYANSAHGLAAAASGGFVQGLLSACITLVMKQLIEALVVRLKGWSARLLPPAACFALSVCLLGLMHFLAGTPEILATMSVPVTVATTYASIYTQTIAARGSLGHE